MTLRAFEYGDPAKVYESREFFEKGCAACLFHQPKPDRTEFHCSQGCKLWPEGTNKTCWKFAKKKRKQ